MDVNVSYVCLYMLINKSCPFKNGIGLNRFFLKAFCLWEMDDKGYYS